MKKLINENKFLGLLVAIIIISGFLLLYPLDYYVVSPGVAKTVAPMVEIEGDSYSAQGDIMLTTVSMKQANTIDYLWIKLFKPQLYELQSMDFLPQDINMDEYFDLMREMMAESQLKSQAVALEGLGYQPQITGKGVKIVQVLETSNAYDKLEEGDIIVGVDGAQVQLLTETVDKIQNRELGAPVQITVKRDDEQRNYSIETKSLEENSGKPSIGVLITPYKRNYDFPIKININAGQIGGPSAGSMFALEIYNQLSEEDITQGAKIAGTGTINLDGSIGKIDGIGQKIVAAKEEGASLFFVPAGNWELAQEIKVDDIELVKVETFEQIIEYLKAHDLT